MYILTELSRYSYLATPLQKCESRSIVLSPRTHPLWCSNVYGWWVFDCVLFHHFVSNLFQMPCISMRPTNIHWNHCSLPTPRTSSGGRLRSLYKICSSTSSNWLKTRRSHVVTVFHLHSNNVCLCLCQWITSVLMLQLSDETLETRSIFWSRVGTLYAAHICRALESLDTSDL